MEEHQKLEDQLLETMAAAGATEEDLANEMNNNDSVDKAYVTVYSKTGHNAACVNIEKRLIDFLKMYCFKPTEGNG